MPEFPMPKLEDVIVGQIVEQFFEPQVVGYEFGQLNGSYSPNGPVMGYTPRYGVAPLMQLAQTIYREHADELAKKVWDKIDVDALTESVAKDCIEKRFSTDSLSGYGRNENAEIIKINEIVRERVAAELTRRQLAKIDEDARLAKLAAEKDTSA